MTESTTTPADLLVAEIGYLFGAKFTVTTSGPNGEERWHYEPTPNLRCAARAFLAGIDRHRNGPFDHEIVAAIRRLEKREAP